MLLTSNHQLVVNKGFSKEILYLHPSSSKGSKSASHQDKKIELHARDARGGSGKHTTAWREYDFLKEFWLTNLRLIELQGCQVSLQHE